MRQIVKKFSSGLLLAVITLLAVLAGNAISQTDALQPLTKQESSDIRPLEPGKQIERELAGDAVHLYSVNLAAGQFLHLIVLQDSIAVAAILIEPGGKKLFEADGEAQIRGMETVMVIAEVSGNYQLEVRSHEKNAAAGKYSVILEGVRTLRETSRDGIAKSAAELYEAKQLDLQYWKLSSEERYDEALPYAERVLAIRERIFGAEDSLGVTQKCCEVISLERRLFTRRASLSAGVVN